LSQLLGVAPDPRHWAIGGFSEGGTCALELGLRHPDVYGTFLDLAGDRAPNLGSPQDTLKHLYGGSQAAMAAHDPANLLRPHAYRNIAGWFIAGASDTGHVTVARSLAAAARSAGMDTTALIFPGGHNWQFAADAFRTVLPTVALRLGAVPAGEATHAAPGT
jgi:S-formylglutathione hydrolase FrmB